MKKKQTTKKTIGNEKIDNSKEVSYDDVVMEEADMDGNLALKKLREKLKKCVEEKQEYLDGWQRAKADFVNARKKDEELRASLVSFAKEGLMLDLLISVDNFDMAFANKEVWESVDQNWRIGIEHIHSQLLKTLEEHGLKQFDPTGDMFDPVRHDSTQTVVVDNKSDDHKVIEVLQKGYEINNKVVRPAKVKVGEFK